MQRFRESLALILIALLPFHALAVTLLTKLIAGPGHAPLTTIASWKEALLGIILFLAAIEWAQKRPWKLSVDWIDTLILALLILTAAVSDVQHTDRGLALLGFKYDFLPLVAFFILRRVQWSDAFRSQVKNVLLWVGGIVAAYGIVTFFLPLSFFTTLGYADLHSLYLPNGPLAAFQQIDNSTIHRIQSTMSGPNQLGIWLLIPLAVAFSSLRQRVTLSPSKGRHADYGFLALLLIALAMTFSRAAWIGAFVMILFALWPSFKPHLTRGRIVGGVCAFIAVVAIVVALFPNALFRISSTRGHLEHPIQALQMMVVHPFGQGLGSAGPATNRVSDACVMLRPQDDPSWAKSQPNLCVFLGTTQVQPKDRVCHCPFLPENWYLQIGVELGWIGFLLFIALIVMLLAKSYPSHAKNASFAFSILLAISVAALFLHAWEDAAVAYTAWMLLASMQPQTSES